jgi:uncharacterized protein
MKLILSFLLLSISIAGCSSSPKPTYYTLSAPTIQATSTKNNVLVMVGPIALPDLLDQPKIVTQLSDNEVKMHDYHRWAGSLKSEIGRVVGAYLAQDMGTSKVLIFSQTTQSNFDYQVFIDVQNLKSTPNEGVVLDMFWTIKSKDTKKEDMMGRSLIRQPLVGSTVQSIVAAQSLAFAKASANIAKAINQK